MNGEVSIRLGCFFEGWGRYSDEHLLNKNVWNGEVVLDLSKVMGDIMKQERFKASLIEKVCVHAYSVPDVLITASMNTFVSALDGGHNFDRIDLSECWKGKVRSYEALVGTYQNGNLKHDEIRQYIDGYHCGHLAIGVAKMFGRI